MTKSMAARATISFKVRLEMTPCPEIPAATSLAGGLGNDILEGGSGADTFLFDVALGINNIDTVKDFDPGVDKIALSLTIFTGVGGVAGGSLSNGQFRLGNSAHDRNDHILYNAKNGKLLYDPDGKNGERKVQIAVLDKHLDLHASDFTLVA